MAAIYSTLATNLYKEKPFFIIDQYIIVYSLSKLQSLQYSPIIWLQHFLELGNYCP
jgi:hypothetical protein